MTYENIAQSAGLVAVTTVPEAIIDSTLTVEAFTTHLINYAKDIRSSSPEDIERWQLELEPRDEYVERKAIYLLAHAGLKLMDLTDENKWYFFSMINSIYEDWYSDGANSEAWEWTEEYTWATWDDIQSTLSEAVTDKINDSN